MAGVMSVALVLLMTVDADRSGEAPPPLISAKG
jgi:hypothetical protein